MFPKHWSFTRIAVHFFCEALTNQKIIRKQQEMIMSALSDLQDQLSGAAGDLSTLQTDFAAFVEENSGGANDSQLQTMTAAVTALRGTIKQIDASLQPPASTPAPPAAS